ncbi:MAG: hypothetical protein KDD92_02155 [Caldilineaceae bacterium]|nr:hypothetical protein [Caldilineaceae bacterium]
MQSLPSRKLVGPALAGLALLLVLAMLRISPNATGAFQSPLPPPSGPCFTQTTDGFTLDVWGYVTNDDGTTTITYRVTNDNKQDISYAAFGLGDWAPVAPTDGATVTGKLGDYHVAWTNHRGNPGFASVKYETEFDGFSQGASDYFVVTVSGFDADDSVAVQLKAGNARTTFDVTLDDPGCDKTPPPTPTATPESPLDTPTPTATPIRSGTPTITPTPIALPNGWYRHVEEEAGFQIDYPPESVSITSGRNRRGPYSSLYIGFILPQVTVGYSYQGMIINVIENNEGLSAEEWIRHDYLNLFDQEAPADMRIEPITLSNVMGYQVDYYPGNTDLQVIVPYENKICVIAMVYGLADGYARPEALDLYYKMIDTFNVLPE